MSAPPKTKPPPPKESDGESDDWSETSDEETEDEEQGEGGSNFKSKSDKGTHTTKKKPTSIVPSKQQGEGGSNFEAKSDKGTDTTKKKPTSIVPSKQQSAVKASATVAPAAGAGIPSKRIQEVNGKREKEDEPQSKKKRLEVATPAAKSAALKKTVKPWLPDEELALSMAIQKDCAHDVYGMQLPTVQADPYWEKLMSRLSFMEKYENEYRVERLSEKVRRMRLRYDSLLTRMKAGETNVWKSDHEGKLWRIWHTILGPLKVTPDVLNGDGDEEDEDESEEESEEEDEEDEPTQAKGPAEGKQPLASKSVPAKDAAPKAMEMDTSQRVASVRNVVLSDELCAEKHSFRCALRGSCVKLVEEAKTQSLLIREICAKTTQIVEDALEKSSQITEELRMVLESLGAIAR